MSQSNRSYEQLGDASPIVPQVSDRMGRIRAGTRLAVREMTDDELGHHVKELMDLDAEPWLRGVHPQRWVVCWADEPELILYDWFSPVGHYNKELCVETAQKYCRARGAVLVDLPADSMGNKNQ